MIKNLIRTGVYLGSSAIGLLVASLLLGDDFSVKVQGFIITVVVFALAQTVLSPFIAKLVAANARAFLGGVGLLSTFVALFIASLIGSSLTINGVSTWIVGTIVVWLATAVATILLPAALLKAGVQQLRDDD